MIRSMTGVGMARRLSEEFDITVRVRSVNNRYLDMYIRLPNSFSEFEHALRQKCSQWVDRGKVDVQFEVTDLRSETVKVVLNNQLVDEIIEASEYIINKPEVGGELDTSVLLNLPGVLKLEALELVDPEKMLVDLEAVAREAFDDLIRTREEEGSHIADDLKSRLKKCEAMLEEISSQSQDLKASYFEKLSQRVQEFTSGLEMDKQRLEQEAALLADRSDITEEVVRLGSHIKQAVGLIENGGVAGKKLDFIVQEMNREINTIGAKGRRADLSSNVVDFKAELEKIREQVQNIE